MGADFSAVRVHVGSQSDELNSRIQARAFTTGSDVFIRRQDYSPTTTSGQRLLAHELAHTVQQGAAPRIRRTLAPSTLIQRDQDEDDAKALEASDRVASPFYGHALDRHGPGVSDTALKTRLATGQAPDGAMVPVAGDDAASGISSKFASHKEYLATRASAHGLAKSQLDATADHLATLIPLAKAAIDDVAGKAGAEKGKAMAAKTKAVLALTNAAADTRKSTNGHLYAPVDSCDKKLMEAKVIAGGVALDDMFTLRPEYEVVIDHGRPIGYGFQGVSGQDLVSGAGKKMRVFDDAAPAKLDMPKTRTTFKVTGNLMLRPKTYTPSAWAVIQHFPADDPVGMRIKGAT